MGMGLRGRRGALIVKFRFSFPSNLVKMKKLLPGLLC
jgi:hypothetical protein